MQRAEQIPMLEIEDVLVTRSHVGREVRVCVPGTPEWIGVLDAWDAEFFYVQIKPGIVEAVQPEYLRWSAL